MTVNKQYNESILYVAQSKDIVNKLSITRRNIIFSHV